MEFYKSILKLKQTIQKQSRGFISKHQMNDRTLKNIGYVYLWAEEIVNKIN